VRTNIYVKRGQGKGPWSGKKKKKKKKKKKEKKRWGRGWGVWLTGVGKIERKRQRTFELLRTQQTGGVLSERYLHN